VRKPPINNFIKAKEIRVIDENGKQIGIMELTKAIELAKNKGLDLVQITDKTTPPVCKITNYGKYLYHLQKKEKKQKKEHNELKGIRLSFGISDHDIEIKSKQAEKFLKKGHLVRIEMILRGREKAHQDLAKEKIEKFLNLLKSSIPVKIETPIKKQPRGLTIIISKSH